MMYYDPFRRMQRLMEAVDRLLDESVVPVRAVDARTSRGEVTIPVNIRAEDDAFVITAWVPGVRPDDLRIEILDDTVTLEGTFAAAEEDHYLVQEIPSGTFRRVLTLPTALEAGEAEAELQHGVLTLRIPKAQAVRPKEIKVKVK